MTLQHFNTLDQEERFNALWEHASYVYDRLEYNYLVALYKFPTFYVELYYDIKHNILKELKAITIEELREVYAGVN